MAWYMFYRSLNFDKFLKIDKIFDRLPSQKITYFRVNQKLLMTLVSNNNIMNKSQLKL